MANGIFRSTYLNNLQRDVLAQLPDNESVANLKSQTVVNAPIEGRDAGGYRNVDPSKFVTIPEPGWWSRTADQEFANQTTRVRFLCAVLNEFGLRVPTTAKHGEIKMSDLTGLISKLPKKVRDAMKAEDYAHTGRPLSLFRVKTVMTAIAGLKGEDNARFQSVAQKIKDDFATTSAKDREGLEAFLARNFGVGKDEINVKLPKLNEYQEKVKEKLIKICGKIKAICAGDNPDAMRRAKDILAAFRDVLMEENGELMTIDGQLQKQVESLALTKALADMRAMAKTDEERLALTIENPAVEDEATATVRGFLTEGLNSIFSQVVCEIFRGDLELLKPFEQKSDGSTGSRFADDALQLIKKEFSEMADKFKSIIPVYDSYSLENHKSNNVSNQNPAYVMARSMFTALEQAANDARIVATPPLDSSDRLTLGEIARTAYGTSQQMAGGRGYMGIVTDQQTGQPRIVKYDTHYFSRSTANSRDARQLDAANALRKRLLSIAGKAGLSRTVLENVRLELGLDPVGQEMSGTTLLTRKAVAKVLGMIDDKVWDGVFNGTDFDSYITQGEGTSFAEVSRSRTESRSFSHDIIDFDLAEKIRPRLESIRTFHNAEPGSAMSTKAFSEFFEEPYAKVLSRILTGPSLPTAAELAAIDKLFVILSELAHGEPKLAVRYVATFGGLDFTRDFPFIQKICTELRAVTGRDFIPPDVLDFMQTLERCTAFDNDAQGAADRNRVFMELLEPSIRLAQLQLRPEMGQAQRDSMQRRMSTERTKINFIIGQLNKGVSDPLPFGKGKRTSGFSPARKDQIRNAMSTPPADLFTLSAEVFDNKYAIQCFNDCGRSMGLTVNDTVINAEGNRYAGDLKAFCSQCRGAFTDQGSVDENAYRLAVWVAQQGTCNVLVGDNSVDGSQPTESFYSPTGIDMFDEKDSVMAVQRPWSFKIKWNRDEKKLSFDCSIQKKDMRSVALEPLGGKVGNSTLAKRHSVQKPLLPPDGNGTNYQKVDVAFGYRLPDSGEIDFTLNKANATYDFQRELNLREVVEGNQNTINKRLAADLDHLVVMTRNVFEKDSQEGRFSKYEFDEQAFRTWFAKNKDGFIADIAALDRGDENLFKQYKSKITGVDELLRYHGLRPESLLVELLAVKYAMDINPSRRKQRPGLATEVKGTAGRLISKANKSKGDEFITTENKESFIGVIDTLSLFRLQQLNAFLGKLDCDEPEDAEKLKEKIDELIRQRREVTNEVETKCTGATNAQRSALLDVNYAKLAKCLGVGEEEAEKLAIVTIEPIGANGVLKCILKDPEDQNGAGAAVLVDTAGAYSKE